MRRGVKCSDAGSLRVLRRVLLTPLPDRATRRLDGPGSSNPKAPRSTSYLRYLSGYCNRKSNSIANFLGIFGVIIQLLSLNYPQSCSNPLIPNGLCRHSTLEACTKILSRDERKIVIFWSVGEIRLTGRARVGRKPPAAAHRGPAFPI